MSRGILSRAVWSALRRNRPSVPPGAGRGDAVRLADSPTLAHLAPAIRGGDALRAVDLLTGDTAFIAPPDPTGWLQAVQAGNPPPAPGAVPLRVLCWNLALLDVHVGPWSYRRSPFVDERRRPVVDLVLADGADIVFLQELWHAVDQRYLLDRAPAAGYRVACPARAHVDGLAVLVREELVTGDLEVEVHPFEVQDRIEALELPGKERFLRSWMRCSFDHPLLGHLTLFDTHFAPYPRAWWRRIVEARSLGLEVARQPADSLVIVAGDLNSGPFYARQSWRTPGDRIDHDWWHNAISLPLLQHYGGLVDLAIRGRSPEDADLEVRQSRLLENDPEAAVRSPLPCTDDHRRAFTATDCNRLYHMQYAGTEQPARLDHILARDPTGRVHVQASRHRFTERTMSVGTERVEPSDHYGVEVELLVSPVATSGTQ
ncbi:MAG: endonuclease/exonuclease/phosphatase family protein [Deltaproteobacteria bacterium]|nr:MAG: endonuclease/exonuclease/phosphatase family protein [Deltaproteobacteria bacterium]